MAVHASQLASNVIYSYSYISVKRQENVQLSSSWYLYSGVHSNSEQTTLTGHNHIPHNHIPTY